MENPIKELAKKIRESNTQMQDWALLMLKSCVAVIERDNYDGKKSERILTDFTKVMNTSGTKNLDELYLLMEADTRDYIIEAMKLIDEGVIKL